MKKETLFFLLLLLPLFTLALPPEAAAAKGTLIAATQDSDKKQIDAPIYVDGVLKGTGKVTLSLSPKTYQVKFGDLTGYTIVSPRSGKKSVQVKSGKPTRVMATYKKSSSTGAASSYIYFKRNGTTTPQTATLANGTLSIDGKTISGVYFSTSMAGVTCLAGGTGTDLTSCHSPQDSPHTMLLCGPDPVSAAPDTLLYVLFDSPDANRVSADATGLLNALQSETNYLGIGVYTDCSGSAHTAWIRNYPYTNYYLWPDVFTTYDAGHVSSLLSGSVIFSAPAAGNIYNQYVAVRSAANVFEVWH
ncbi:MAG: hypothetical protein HZA01_14540 [Nitrospinae bacterium]|nr:hypothetical protein [Nitrospinota bacterium]